MLERLEVSFNHSFDLNRFLLITKSIRSRSAWVIVITTILRPKKNKLRRFNFVTAAAAAC